MDQAKYYNHGQEGIIMRVSDTLCCKVFLGAVWAAKDAAEHEYEMLSRLYESSVNVPEPSSLSSFDLTKKHVKKLKVTFQNPTLGSVFEWEYPDDFLYGMRPAIFRQFIEGKDAGYRIFPFNKSKISDTVRSVNRQIERAGYILGEPLPQQYILNKHKGFLVDCSSIEKLASHEVGWSERTDVPITYYDNFFRKN